MDYMDYLKFFAALVFVLALMGGLAFILKRLGYGHTTLQGNREKRLKLLEVLPLDARRKAVLLQCDEKQHLVILAPTGDTVIDNNVKPTKKAPQPNKSKKKKNDKTKTK